MNTASNTYLSLDKGKGGKLYYASGNSLVKQVY